MCRRLLTWVAAALTAAALTVVPTAPATAATAAPWQGAAQLLQAPAAVLYLTQYDGAIHEPDGSGGARRIDEARWRDVYRYQAPVPAPTDYVKYPWSSTVYAVTFWSGDSTKWLWQALSLSQWQRAGSPAPRTAGWIAGSTYHRWATSDELFVRGADGVTHKLTYAEWQASGFRPYETRTNQGFQKLTWAADIAQMSSISAGQGKPITYPTWLGEGLPSPQQVRRFPGDEFSKDACRDAVMYAGPTMSRAVTYQEYVAAGAPQVRIDDPRPCAAPTVTSLAPSTGPSGGGTEVVITGTSFDKVTAVSFGTIPAASFTVDSTTRLRATSPAAMVGPATVRVTTSAGSSSGGTSTFTYTLAPPVVPAVKDVTGAITTDATWGPSRAGVYRVTGDLTVAAGVTLTLQPGTVVKVQAGRTIGVDGTIVAQGSAQSPIVITSERDDSHGGDTNGDGGATLPRPGDYVGLSVRGTGSLLTAHVRMAYAATAVAAQAADGSVPTLGLTDTAISQSTQCVRASGPVDATFSGSVRDCGIGVTADHAFDARGVDWGSTSGPFPYGTGIAVEGVSVRVAPWTGYSAPARPTVAAAQAPPTESVCADVVMVGARGSGEAPVAPSSTTPPVFEADASGFGSYNYVIASEMVQQIAASRPATSVKYLGVHYLALQTPAYDTSVSYPRFLASLFDGVDKLRQLVATESQRCPGSAFVLIGSSQGALVIDLMLDLVTQAEQRQRIVGVVLLADPGRTAASTETLWEGADRPAAAGVADVGGFWTDFYPGFDTPLPSWVAPRTISMCHQGDVACAFGPGASLDPHLSYTVAEMQALARWQSSRVVAALPRP